MPNPKYRVTAECLNFRKEPSIRSEVIKSLKKGLIVEAIGISNDHYWIKSQIDGQVGWMSHKYLKLIIEDVMSLSEPYPWYLIAMSEIGVKEIPGISANSRIIEYLKSTNLDLKYASTDETPWCSAFVNWCVEKSGYEGTDSAWARSWLNWGKELKQPVPGCIVVFERGAESGHVGFFVGESADTIKVLGGNQNNSVNQSEYPRLRLLGYRVA